MTKEETMWLKKLQKLLDKCPSNRLGFYTVGDKNIMIYDTTLVGVDEVASECGKNGFEHYVHKYDAYLDDINFPSCVHSVAG